jgi:hypothetical protein
VLTSEAGPEARFAEGQVTALGYQFPEDGQPPLPALEQVRVTVPPAFSM